MRPLTLRLLVCCLVTASAHAQQTPNGSPTKRHDAVKRVFAPGNSTALPTPHAGARLAISADGNYNDADDWGATPLTTTRSVRG